MYLVDIKDKMKLYNDSTHNIIDQHHYRNLADFILDIILPTTKNDSYGYINSLDDNWVFISTINEGFKVRRKQLRSYTDNDNDCIEIKVNKNLYKYIDVNDIIAIEYEEDSLWE